MRRGSFTAAFALAAVLALLPAEAQQDHEVAIVRSTFRVDAAQTAYWSFKIPTYVVDGRIAGNAMAAGGAGNDIRLLVMTEQQFQLWQLNRQTQSLFDSGQRRSVVLSVRVNDPGTYYVVFDNRFSLVSPKNVSADVRFVYKGIDTNRAEDVKRQVSERAHRIARIMERLVPPLQAAERQMGTHQIRTPLYFGIQNDPTLNAFADWSRRLIVVNRGTLEYVETLQTEQDGDDVLAGVLAHELAHVFYRHSFGNQAGQAQEAIIAGGAGMILINPAVGLLAGAFAYDQNLRYDRMQEAEADLLGIRLACAAGFDAAGLLVFMRRLNEPGSQMSFLQNHPSPARRVEYLEQEVGKLSCPTRAKEVETRTDPRGPVSCPPGTYWTGKGCTSRP